jgi:serine phosphatase RsbU (regulator of sigma subunit)
VDGTERLGVADVHLPAEMSADDPPVRAGVAALVGLVGHLVMAKSAYGDSLRVARRSRPMSTEGELLWRNLPPLTFATEDLVITAVLEPCYQVGGDAFDYAVDDDVARLAIFDAVGHGLRAGLTSVLTLAATRSARTGGADLNEMAAAADAALTSQFDDVRYTTAFLAELNLDDGLLRYVNAGHPAPVLLRGGRAVAELDSGRRMPLGLGDSAPVLSEYPLQEGDRILLYTDGITEARDEDGSLFGVDRLIDLAERNLAEGRSLPETLRRVSHAVLDHQHHARQDDATLMLVEWAAHAGHRVRP